MRLVCALLFSLTLAAWAKPAPPANLQKPVNSPRPLRSTGTTTTPARPQVFTGTVVSQTTQSLILEGNGKRQTFRLSERSKVTQMKNGTKVLVTYTTTPQGNEVVKAVVKPSKSLSTP